MSLEDAVLCLEAQAKGEIPDHRLVVSGALALDTLILLGIASRDIQDAAAGLRIVAEGGTLALDDSGRARASILAADVRRFVNFDESKET
ncbi:MAG: hypothetical protein EPN64_04715 [Burkholderiaceae bacterium]|nr:MAG: hypothetical protein EPN64_04715 [Burkholderiaceae bacterium]